MTITYNRVEFYHDDILETISVNGKKRYERATLEDEVTYRVYDTHGSVTSSRSHDHPQLTPTRDFSALDQEWFALRRAMTV